VLLTGDVLATRNPLTGRVGPQVMPSGLNRDTPMALAGWRGRGSAAGKAGRPLLIGLSSRTATRGSGGVS
jgi:hypothetical protein